MPEFDNFNKVKVLVVGDVMIDRYLWGDVSRISPEAPVPVVRLKKTSLIAGGAANVAANVAGLGGTPYLVGIIGNDDEGRLFPKVLAAASISENHLVEIPSRQTTIKTRILAHNQQIARVDQETIDNLSAEQEAEVWQKIEILVREVEVIVISDYNKGFLSETLVSRLIRHGNINNKVLVVDPKGKNYDKYRGATVITPNKFELAEVSGIDANVDALIDIAAEKLLSELDLEALLVTRGEDGITVFQTGRDPLDLRSLARHVYDVTGAGDTVIACFAVAVAAGESFSSAAEIANSAAGLVVEEIGTTSIKLEKLRKFYESTVRGSAGN